MAKTAMVLAQVIPVEVWAAVAGVVGGVFLTLFGVLIAHWAGMSRLKYRLKHEDKVRNEAMFKERLEDLYVTSKKYLSGLYNSLATNYKVLNGELTYEQALTRIVNDNVKAENSDYYRMEMLIDLYFGNLKQSYDELIGLSGSLKNIWNMYKEQSKEEGITENQLELFRNGLNELKDMITRFEIKVAQVKAIS